jgi:4-oxalocrotonate tautomerase
MSIISCDLREGRTEEQKRALTFGLIDAVRTATGETVEQMFMVIREGQGINFIEAGEHLPNFVPGNADDTALLKALRDQR